MDTNLNNHVLDDNPGNGSTTGPTEYKYRAIVEQSSDGIVLIDHDGTVIEWNDAQERIMGIAREHALGRPIWNVIKKCAVEETCISLEQIREYVIQVLQTGESPWLNRFVEYQVQRPDGTYPTIQAIAFPVQTESGYMLGAITRDVTAVRQAENTVRRSEQKFRSLIEQSRDGICLIDEDGIMLEWNSANEQITLLKRQNVIGRVIWDVLTKLHPSNTKGSITVEHVQNAISVLLTGSPPVAQDYVMLIERSDGTRRYIETSLFPITMDGKKLMGAATRDVTAHKMAEDALKHSENTLRSVIEQTHDGVCLINMDGIIVEWNRGYEEISSLPRDQVLGRYMWDVVYGLMVSEHKTPGKREQQEHLLRRILAMPFSEWTQPVLDRLDEVEVQRPDGTRRYLHMTIFPIQTDQATLICAMSRDVTDQKQADKQQLELGLERERVALLHNIISDVSHDLMTPLSTVKTSLYMLENLHPSDAQSKHLGKINTQIKLLHKLLDDMLFMSRLDALKASDFKLRSSDANALVSQVVTEYDSAASLSGQTLTFNNEGRLPATLLDEHKMVRALSNLLNNAVEHTPPGGTITVSTGVLGDTILIDVANTGEAISEQDLPHIFDRFYRGEKHRPVDGGSGLGLSIARTIIEGHHGHIEVLNNATGGCVFRITLPIREPDTDSLCQIMEGLG
ncbi:MAG: PAS domain-containing sensor histidine kinase [Anaerolineae bacterium]|nr:PAS domain-containing sensor histidine kinase [Anaerolineae bacterium]